MRNVRSVNTKGFTFIEIIVVCMITVLLLATACTYILTKSGYFEKAMVADKDKQTVESIVRYVNDELIFATDILIQDTMPEGDGWKWFSMQDDHLLHNDEESFTDGYYGGRKLQFIIKGYDGNRLDMRFTFFDKEQVELYAKKNTLQLLNLTYSKDQKGVQYAPFSGISKEVNLNTDTSYKVYYKKKLVETNK